MKKLIAFVLSLVMTAALAVPSTAAGLGAVSTTRAAATSTTKSQKSGTQAGTRQVRPAASQNLNEITTSYNNPNGRVLCAAKSGMPRNYPEDSLAGIQACIAAGVDIVAVNVQKTRDNQLVVMEDSTLKRMCVNQIDRKTASGKVSHYTLDQMTGEFYLRNGRGGPNRSISSQRVPSLSQAIRASKQGCMLYISNGWKYADLVNNAARAEDACGSVIIGGAASVDKAKAFIESAGTPICPIAGSYNDGETEGSAKTFVSDSLIAGISTVLLRSKSQYSSVFKKSTMKEFNDAGRAMINATQRAFCGDYKDDIEGWESLIDSGYSIIETDYPQELATYISDIETYRANLRSLMAQANALNLSNYDKTNARQLDKALKEADEVVNLGAVSRTQIDNARYDLQEALDALDTGEVVPKKRMNPVGIVVIILVVLAVLALLLVHGRRKHKKPAKNSPKPSNSPEPAADPEDPTLKEIAAKAGQEFREEAGELTNAARSKIRERRSRKGTAPAKQTRSDKPKTDKEPSLFDQFDDKK